MSDFTLPVYQGGELNLSTLKGGESDTVLPILPSRAIRVQLSGGVAPNFFRDLIILIT